MNTRARILKLLADGRFHSGTEMGRLLGVSRTAICKGIKTLSARGLDIHCVSGRGYKLALPLQPLERSAIEAHLQQVGAKLRGAIEVLEEVDSTNAYLLARTNTSAILGRVCLAEVQRQGRGRRGRAWIASPYRNLMLSMAWRFPQGPEVITGLSLAAGAAVLNALDDYGVSETALKWPNDILCRDRKLAGILIDIRGEAAGPILVVLGVGINGQIDAGDAGNIDQTWVDLHTVTTGTVDRNRLAAQVIRRLWRMFEVFSAEGFAPFRDAWQRHHLYAGKQVRLRQGETEINGVVEGIDENGALCLRDASGLRRTLYSGEISSIRAAP